MTALQQQCRDRALDYCNPGGGSSTVQDVLDALFEEFDGGVINAALAVPILSEEVARHAVAALAGIERPPASVV